MNILGLILPNWLFFTAIILAVLYKYFTWNFGYWKSQNVQTPQPVYPLFGNMLGMYKNTVAEIDMACLKSFGKTWGTYMGRNPELHTADLELIKAIGIRDFQNFADRRKIAGMGPIASYFLNMMEGEEWKAHRSVLTPTFTSGKIKQMGVLIEECSGELSQFIRKSIEDGKTEMEMKDLFSSFTMNVIASCCFGYKINHQDPNDPFLKYAKILFTGRFNFNVLFALLLPTLFELTGLSVFPVNAFNYFQKIVNQVIEMRKEDTANRRGDFLDLLLDSETEGFADSKTEGKNKHVDLSHYDIGSELKTEGRAKNEKIMTPNAVVGHSILFLLAGYDTTASTISFASYFMALNPDCQEKLVAEISNTLEKHGKLNYDSVGEMQYLDKVISETLRIHPPALMTDRRCLKTSTYNGIQIQKDMNVAIAIYAVHHDEDNYPNPEKFDPERFSTENKASRNPLSYIPFGLGPRNCVGMRFALIEAKIGLANFFREYRVSPCSKTELPLIMQKANGLLKPVNGVHLNVEKRI